ncbi:MAG: hypothetical protein GC188_06720 [Alphaproteobacteria bacterium]|nr:hypothetical protein [Alphaproteobacteria bacterium]
MNFFCICTLFATAMTGIHGQTDALSGPVTIERQAGEREGRQRAAEIAAIYWEYEVLAETLHEAEAELGFLNDLTSSLGRPLPVNVAERVHSLRENVLNRVRTAADRQDVFELLDRAPGAANLLVRYIRYGADFETSQQLLEQMSDNLGSGGLYPLMYDTLAEQLDNRQRDRHAEPDTTTPADEAALSAFNTSYADWIDQIRLLGRLEGRDNFTRNLIIGQFGLNLTPDVREALIEANRNLIDTIDAENTLVALALVDEYGFDQLHAASSRLTGSITGLVHHGGTTEERRTLLTAIEPLALSGQYSGQQYALMYDRLAKREGRPQRYGTQSECVGGRLEIYTLENEDLVDDWRDQVGLGPVQPYLALLRQTYGETC